ncbi:hypothetical protein [Rhizobium mongolense]|uniref:Uncharacterized protein n=2 Tax=Rhizobium mongolense TaxID=57676 RepID=A0ABR6IQ69_9HYPH|nr:hypothetical protein [Rhizobium mongolense]MBB4230022.1 hypothetical protein [Rhizobium mongolense]TVZ72846.1 hypothetical protein BCL32_1033 [Rhizobium mongolense USDA 1844]
MADKSNRAAMPWENDPIVEPATQSAPWENDPIVEEAAPKAFSSTDIDPVLQVPKIVRAQVGALDKPEDRLRTLRQTYPDAQPYNGDNFIMTDPQTGKTMVYNQESWIPDLNDAASLIPEIGEGIGAIGGAVTGAAIGGTSGSVVPLAGTAAGAVTGGAIGAGTGATIGREAAQRGANWFFGNEDTRTTGEQLGDAAKTFALNAAGEGIGLGVAPFVGKAARGVGSAVKDGPTGFVIGKVDDPALAAQRVADARNAGIDLTAGMISGSKNTALKEQALAATTAGKQIQDRIEGAWSGLDRRANEIVGDITPQTLSKQELGQALKDQSAQLKAQTKARNDYLYDRAGELTGDAQASGLNTRQYLGQLQAEREAMGKSAALNNGKSIDSVIAQAQAVVDDIGTGVNFNVLKEARTSVGAIANDPGVDQVLRDRAQGLYSALTRDMGDTAQSAGGDALQAWKKANNYSRRMRDPKSIFSTKGSVDEILKKKTPEEASDWVLGQANKGGTRMNVVRRQIERTEGGRELWDSLSGSAVERMMYEGDQLNPTRFWKQWNAVSPEAKNALFSGTRRAQHRGDLDALSRLSENFKNYRRMDNHSNTNKTAGVMSELNPLDKTTLLGALFLGPKALAVSAAGKAANFGYKRWQAKLLANPDAARWFRNVPNAQMQKGGLKAHLGRLKDIAANTSDNALAVAINDYFGEIGYSN